MEDLAASIMHHGYPILFGLVFAESIGMPIPAALALVVAGGISAKGPLHYGLVLTTALAALLLGDSMLFLLGRTTGWWLLGMLCKISLHPDSCVLRSAESFRKRGKIMLALAKFVPGINTLAPPLAGSMNMRFGQFFPLDLAGASLYAITWSLVGYGFSDFVSSIGKGFQMGSFVVTVLLIAGVVSYLGYHFVLLLKAAKLSYVPRLLAREVARNFYSELHSDMVVFDVRSHGYYSKKASRIKGSDRLEPNTIMQRLESMPRDKEIVLYCTCQGDATSMRVARILQQHGFRTAVIKDGLRAWKKGGFPLETVPESDVILMPTF